MWISLYKKKIWHAKTEGIYLLGTTSQAYDRILERRLTNTIKDPQERKILPRMDLWTIVGQDCKTHCAIDIQNAFDTVGRDKRWKILKLNHGNIIGEQQISTTKFSIIKGVR